MTTIKWPCTIRCGNKAVSNTTLISSGLTTPRAEVTTISRLTASTFRRYGLNAPITRFTVPRSTGRASRGSGTRAIQWKGPPPRRIPIVLMRIRPPREMLGSSPQRRHLDGPAEDRLHHRRGQPAGEGVLLARMEGPDQPVPTGVGLRSMAEPRL